MASPTNAEHRGWVTVCRSGTVRKLLDAAEEIRASAPSAFDATTADFTRLAMEAVDEGRFELAALRVAHVMSLMKGVARFVRAANTGGR